MRAGEKMHIVEDAGGGVVAAAKWRIGGAVGAVRGLSVLLASPLGDLDHVGQGLLDLLPATGLETAVRVDEDAASGRTTSASSSGTTSRVSRDVLLLVREGLHESGEAVLHLLDARDTRPAKGNEKGQRSLPLDTVILSVRGYARVDVAVVVGSERGQPGVARRSSERKARQTKLTRDRGR